MISEWLYGLIGKDGLIIEIKFKSNRIIANANMEISATIIIVSHECSILSLIYYFNTEIELWNWIRVARLCSSRMSNSTTMNSNSIDSARWPTIFLYNYKYNINWVSIFTHNTNIVYYVLLLDELNVKDEYKIHTAFH